MSRTSFRVNPHSIVCLDVKEFLARSRRHIRSLGDSNGTWTHNDLVRKKSLRPATLLKWRLWHRCFPVNFAIFLKTLFLQNTSAGSFWRLWSSNFVVYFKQETTPFLYLSFFCIFCLKFDQLAVFKSAINKNFWFLY